MASSKRLLLLIVGLVAGCSMVDTTPISSFSSAQLAPSTNFTRDLAQLPSPKGRIVAAVYGFKDQTGQNKIAPDIYSTAVTQGGASILVKALRDSKWFVPVERENLNDILTERKLVRQTDAGNNGEGKLPGLMGAALIIEGAIVGYDSNVKTGGLGAKYLGISLANQYRADQVTVNLRAVDIYSGQILHTVTTSKTVYSVQVTGGFYRFVDYKTLGEAEVGMTVNEPAQIAVQEAIEAAVVNLIVDGIDAHSWSLASLDDLHAPVLDRYRNQRQRRLDEAPSVEPKQLADANPDSAFTRKDPAHGILPTASTPQAKKVKSKPAEPASTAPGVEKPRFGFDDW